LSSSTLPSLSSLSPLFIAQFYEFLLFFRFENILQLELRFSNGTTSPKEAQTNLSGNSCVDITNIRSPDHIASNHITSIIFNPQTGPINANLYQEVIDISIFALPQTTPFRETPCQYLGFRSNLTHFLLRASSNFLF
jgi:hypothetical protein